jgi:hypothetical protein
MSGTSATTPARGGVHHLLSQQPTRSRVRIVAVALAAGAATIAVVVLWRPGIPERNVFDYDLIAPARDALFWSSLAGGVAVAITAIAFGIATCVLAQARGALAATVGAAIAGVGGVAYATGLTAVGTLGWYATQPAALPREAGVALLSYFQDGLGVVGAPIIGGFLLFTLGSLVLAAALWRSGAVPLWWPIGFAALTVAVFVLTGQAQDIAQALQNLMLLVVAAVLWRATARPTSAESIG